MNAALPRASSLRCFKPSAKQEKYVRDGLAFLTMTSPFFAHILYSEMEIRYTNDVPWAATDGHSIFMNPDGLAKMGWGPDVIAFVLGHEVFHYIFGDLVQATAWRQWQHVKLQGGASLPYDGDTMNIAMDYRINAAMVEGRIGTIPTKDVCYDTSISARGMESCVEIYEKIYKAPKQGKQPHSEHFEPSDQDPNAEIRRQQAVAGAIQAAEAAGMADKLPEVVKRMVSEVLNPKVKWQEHLRSSMHRAAAEPALDWHRINRRMITRPDKIVYARKTNFGAGTIVFVGDTSGSCFDKLPEFMAEAQGIANDLSPERMIFLMCDVSVHDHCEIENISDVQEALDAFAATGGIGGGGGTDFGPAFNWVEDNNIEPDMLVFCTDGYGSFPIEEPRYPVVWASISRPPEQYPFGKVVMVEIA